MISHYQCHWISMMINHCWLNGSDVGGWLTMLINNPESNIKTSWHWYCDGEYTHVINCGYMRWYMCFKLYGHVHVEWNVSVAKLKTAATHSISNRVTTVISMCFPLCEHVTVGWVNAHVPEGWVNVPVVWACCRWMGEFMCSRCVDVLS